MKETAFSGIGHLDLSVSDVEASAKWYEQVLGLRRLRRVDFPRRTMIVLRHEKSGLVVGLNQHQGFPGEPFDEQRAGLDHVGFAVDQRGDLDAWQERLVKLGVEHSPVADTEVGSALVFRDPDHIQLEFWWSKPVGNDPASPGIDRRVIEYASPWSVNETTQHLVDVATAAGITIFATIDHRAGARSVGLDMPETRVVIVGNPAVGTALMLAAPTLAIELPTRLLVRETSSGAPGSTVVVPDPEDIARRYELTTEQVAGLAAIARFVERALEPATDD